MANIKVLNNKFIIEGHTSKEECDTLTQVANILDKSKEFKTIEYKNGYAEFERVVNSEELKFVNDPMQTTFSWDAHISQISFYAMGATGDSFSVLYTSTNSGDMVQYMGNTSYSYTMTVNVVLEEGYVLDTITGEDTTISNITNTTFDFAVLGNFTMPGNIVITSKVNNPNIQIPITKNGKTTLATKGTKNAEDIDINVDISPTIQSLSITPSETSQTFNASNVDGYKPVNVSAIQTETPSVDLSLVSGNQTVNASSGKYIKSLTIKKPSTLIGSNIKKNVVIAGITGTYEFKTQNKTFTPTQTGGSVSADSDYDGLGVVTVNPVPLGNKTDVPLNFYNQTAGTIADSQNIYSDENKFMTWASVSRPSTLIAENIKKDINIAGITGTLESGGSSFPLFTGLFRFYTAPVISIENNTFSIATSVSNATSYEVYSDNVLLTTLTSSSETIDLSTLITDENTHTIYAIAKADGYADSSKSNEFSYTKVSTFYTVTLPSSGWDSSYTPEYSLNNGITWHEFSASATIQTAQIKFRVTGYFTSSGPGGNWSQTELTSTKLGMNITAGGSGYPDEVISDNYTLTQDIDDITCYYNVCCFVEGTQVLMANGTHKNIENIEVGEQVLTYNEENSSFEIDNVTRMVINPNTVDLATIVLSDNSRITFNAYHPFLTTEGFKSLTQHEGLPKLEIGDVLVSNKNNLTIIDIEREQLSTPIKTYNLTISRNHNFLVGEKDSFVVAHNIACPI